MILYISKRKINWNLPASGGLGHLQGRVELKAGLNWAMEIVQKAEVELLGVE